MNYISEAKNLSTDEINEAIYLGRFEYADKMIQQDLDDPESGYYIIGRRICQRIDVYKATERKAEALELAEETLKTAKGKLREILLVKIVGLKASLDDKYNALDLAVETHERTSLDRTKEITGNQIRRLALKLHDDKTVATLGLGAEEFEKLFAEQPTGSDDPVLDLFIRYNNGENMMDELNALLGKQDKKNRNPDVRLQTLAAYIKSSGGSSIRREIAAIRGKVPSEVVSDLRRTNSFVATIKKKETVGRYLELK